MICLSLYAQIELEVADFLPLRPHQSFKSLLYIFYVLYSLVRLKKLYCH